MTNFENERIMECTDCGKKSDRAKWVGEATLEDGSTVAMRGIVGFDGDTDCLTLDPLIEQIDGEVEGCTGDVYCPFCESENFY